MKALNLNYVVGGSHAVITTNHLLLLKCALEYFEMTIFEWCLFEFSELSLSSLPILDRNALKVEKIFFSVNCALLFSGIC